MFDTLYQYLVTFCILFLAGALIVIFGAIIAVAVYVFIWLHVEAYKWLKGKVMGVYNGIVSANA